MAAQMSKKLITHFHAVIPSPAAGQVDLASKSLKLVMIDFCKGRSLDYKTELYPAGIHECFEKFKMAANKGIVA